MSNYNNIHNINNFTKSQNESVRDKSSNKVIYEDNMYSLDQHNNNLENSNISNQAKLINSMPNRINNKGNNSNLNNNSNINNTINDNHRSNTSKSSANYVGNFLNNNKKINLRSVGISSHQSRSNTNNNVNENSNLYSYNNTNHVIKEVNENNYNSNNNTKINNTQNNTNNHINNKDFQEIDAFIEDLIKEKEQGDITNNNNTSNNKGIIEIDQKYQTSEYSNLINNNNSNNTKVINGNIEIDNGNMNMNNINILNSNLPTIHQAQNSKEEFSIIENNKHQNYNHCGDLKENRNINNNSKVSNTNNNIIPKQLSKHNDNQIASEFEEQYSSKIKSMQHENSLQHSNNHNLAHSNNFHNKNNNNNVNNSQISDKTPSIVSNITNKTHNTNNTHNTHLINNSHLTHQSNTTKNKSNFEQYNVQKLAYELVKEYTHYFKPDQNNDFMKRMLFDVFKRQTKEKRINELIEISKVKIDEDERIEAFNRLIDDANRRIEANHRVSELQNQLDLNNDLFKRKYNSAEWESIYEHRFKKYMEERVSAIREAIEYKQKIEMEKERKYLEETKAKKVPRSVINESVNRMYKDAERRILKKQEILSKKEYKEEFVKGKIKEVANNEVKEEIFDYNKYGNNKNKNKEKYMFQSDNENLSKEISDVEDSKVSNSRSSKNNMNVQNNNLMKGNVNVKSKVYNENKDSRSKSKQINNKKSYDNKSNNINNQSDGRNNVIYERRIEEEETIRNNDDSINKNRNSEKADDKASSNKIRNSSVNNSNVNSKKKSNYNIKEAKDFSIIGKSNSKNKNIALNIPKQIKQLDNIKELNYENQFDDLLEEDEQYRVIPKPIGIKTKDFHQMSKGKYNKNKYFDKDLKTTNNYIIPQNHSYNKIIKTDAEADQLVNNILMGKLNIDEE